MSVTSYSRGHEIYFDSKVWRYSDDDTPLENNERPCKRCGKLPTKEGHDYCLGEVHCIVSGCCGHGVKPPMLYLKPGYTLSTIKSRAREEMEKYFNERASVLAKHCNDMIRMGIKPDDALNDYHRELDILSNSFKSFLERDIPQYIITQEKQEE